MRGNMLTHQSIITLTPALSLCTVRGHRERLFGDMVDTYN